MKKLFFTLFYLSLYSLNYGQCVFNRPGDVGSLLEHEMSSQWYNVNLNNYASTGYGAPASCINYEIVTGAGTFIFYETLDCNAQTYPHNGAYYLDIVSNPSAIFTPLTPEQISNFNVSLIDHLFPPNSELLHAWLVSNHPVNCSPQLNISSVYKRLDAFDMIFLRNLSTFELPPTICRYTGTLNLADYVTTLSGPIGNFTGQGVTDSTHLFNINGLSGTIQITYNQTNGNGVSKTITKNITIIENPNVNLASIPPVCQNGSSFALTQGSPMGGTYKVNDVIQTNFNPSSYSIGNQLITYTCSSNNCLFTDSQTINVLGLPSNPTLSNVAQLLFQNMELKTYIAGCKGSPVTINIQNPPTGYQYNWYGSNYDLILGNNPNGQFTTANIYSGMSYYVKSINLDGCQSAYQKFYILSEPTPLLPDANYSNFICSGDSLYIEAIKNLSSTDTAYDYNSVWYNSGGTEFPYFYNRDTLTIANYTNQSSFQLSTKCVKRYSSDALTYVNNFLVCESPKKSITIPVTPLPEITFDFTGNNYPDVCQNGAYVTLNQASPVGGTYKVDGVVKTMFYPYQYSVGIHYIEYSITVNGCTSKQTKSINVLGDPGVPTVANIAAEINNGTSLFHYVAGCEGQTINIQVASVPSGYSYNWYNSADNFIINNSGNITTTFIASGIFYYVQSKLSNGCTSIKYRIDVIPVPVPTPPNVNSQNYVCYGHDLSMYAVKGINSDPLNYDFISYWYNMNDTVIHTGDTLDVYNAQSNINNKLSTKCFRKPTQDHNYTIPNFPVCESSKRPNLVPVEIIPTPVTTGINASGYVCYDSDVTILATNQAANTVKWYNAADSLIFIGNPLTMQHIISPVNDKLQFVSSHGCLSDFKIISVNVNPQVLRPKIVQNIYNVNDSALIYGCEGKRLRLDIFNPQSGSIYSWYNSAGVFIYPSDTLGLTMPSYSSGFVPRYSVVRKNQSNNCDSYSEQIKISTMPIPNIPYINGPALICKNTDTSLYANHQLSPVSSKYKYTPVWYDSLNNVIGRRDTLHLNNYLRKNKYYLSTRDTLIENLNPLYNYQIVPLCESSKSFSIVDVDSAKVPLVNVDSVYCAPANITLTVTNTTGNTTKWFQNNAVIQTGGTLNLHNVWLPESLQVKNTNTHNCVSPARNIFLNLKKPTADFSVIDTSVEPSALVHFVNSSVNANSYYWNFGDGSISYENSPFHYFYMPGNFDVKLIVTDSHNCKDTVTKSSYIRVNGIEDVYNIKSILIYPNPVRDLLNIEVESDGVIPDNSIEIYNLLGEKLQGLTFASKITVDMSKYSSGIYFLKIAGKTVKINKE